MKGVQRLRAELAAGPASAFGEGPLWDERDGSLWWTDIPGALVHRLDRATGDVRTTPVAQEVGAIALRASGGLVVAARDGFAVLGADGALEPLAPVHAGDPAMRMNDGKVDRAGRFYASTMRFAADERSGRLLRLDPDLSVHEQAGGLLIGNGLDWSEDGRTLYFTDTMDHGIDAFDADPATGALSGRRRLFDVPEDEGWPDGFCIDDEGALWVALWKGSSVRRYTPDGELLAVVDLPVSNVTCCAFGGPGLDELWITTAAPRFAGLAAEEPLGGGVFRVRPGVTGPPPGRFAG